MPGEVEPDAKVLQGRQTKDEAIEAYQVVADEIKAVNDEVAARKDITFTEKKYNTFEELAKNLFIQEGVEKPTKRQLQARIEDLKKDNPDLKDGELIGKKVRVGVAQSTYDKVAKAEQKRKAEEAEKQKIRLEKESAKSIYNDLMKAIDGVNDDDDIYKALKQIDSPTEMAEVERLLQAKGYKADNYYSAVERFMQDELGDSKSYDTSFDEMEGLVKTWIANGTFEGDKAIDAQARLAARLIIDGCDGLGTDVDEAKEGVRLIKAPKITGDPAVDNANAKKVYDQVEHIIKNHTSFGAGFDSLKDYLEGDVTDAEIKYIDGILAQSNAIQGQQKATAVKDLIREDPDYQEAMKYKAEKEALEKELFATNSLKALNDKFGPAYSSVDELDPETIRLWNLGTPLETAYAANNWESIRDAAVKKASVPKDNGKSHLKPVTGSSQPNNTREISKEELDACKIFGFTEEQVKEYINRTNKK